MHQVAQRLTVHPVDVRRRASAHAARTAARDGSRRLWLVSFDRRASARSAFAE